MEGKPNKNVRSKIELRYVQNDAGQPEAEQVRLVADKLRGLQRPNQVKKNSELNGGRYQKK